MSLAEEVLMSLLWPSVTALWQSVPSSGTVPYPSLGELSQDTRRFSSRAAFTVEASSKTRKRTQAWPLLWPVQFLNLPSFQSLLSGAFWNLLLLLLSRFSHVRLCATLWTAAHQVPLSTGYSRQEDWSGLPFPSPVLEPWGHFFFSSSCIQPDCRAWQSN